MASSAPFLKKEPINDLNDISYVNPEIEDKSNLILTFEIFKDSIFNILPMLLLILTDSLNLIAIGHGGRNVNPDSSLNILNTNSKIDTNYLDYFNFFEISVIYLNLFGFMFSLGTIHRIKKENYNYIYNSSYPVSSPSPLQRHYITLKCLLVTLTVLIIIPLIYSSYFILSYIYSDVDLETNGGIPTKTTTNHLIWHMYTNFLIFTPIFIFTQLLLQLNFKILQIYNQKSICLGIFLLHIGMQSLGLYILVVKLSLGAFGVAISLTIASSISYIYSNYIISLNENFRGSNRNFNNFYFFCDYSELNTHIIHNFNSLKSYLFPGIFTYLEYAGFGFFLLFSFFISTPALTTNIILHNFFAFLHTFGKGFSQTLRQYVQLSTSSYKHSHIGKKRFIKFLSIVAFILAIIFASIILIFEGEIAKIYIDFNQEGPNDPLGSYVPNLFSQIANFFALVIFFDYISKVLDGYVKGIDAKTTHLLIYKISFLLLFLPAGLVLCFSYNYGLLGFWMVIYIYIIIYTILNLVYVYSYYTMWIR